MKICLLMWKIMLIVSWPANLPIHLPPSLTFGQPFSTCPLPLCPWGRARYVTPQATQIFAASSTIPYKICGLALHDYLSASWYFTAVIFYHFYRTNIYLFIFQYCGLHSGPTPWATPSALFCEGIFPEIGSWWTMCLGWLQIVKLLISASWVAKIADINIVCM
jgi:hypothetical protein